MVAMLVLEASAERRRSSSLRPRTKFQMCCSSVVEQMTVNHLVGGSSPPFTASFRRRSSVGRAPHL